MMPVPKVKEVILLKKLIRKYGHVWMLSYAFIYIPWFARLQENINKPYHVMHTALDDMIPFEEIFIVPYLMWFLYVAATIAFFFFRNRDDYYRLCTFLFTGMTISLLVCTLFPNGRTSVQRSIRIKIFSATWYRDSGALIRASTSSRASMYTTPSVSTSRSATAKN